MSKMPYGYFGIKLHSCLTTKSKANFCYELRGK